MPQPREELSNRTTVNLAEAEAAAQAAIREEARLAAERAEAAKKAAEEAARKIANQRTMEIAATAKAKAKEAADLAASYASQVAALPKPGDPVGGGGGSSGGGSTTTTKEPELMAIDWKSWLTDWGFPTDVINTLDSMARRYTPAQAELFTRDAILYLRGTDWHKKTFVGFADAYKNGLVQDERQYRDYVTHANDAYKRYHGRDITSPELVSAFTSGYNPTRVEQELEGQAYVNANRDDLQYLGGNFGEGRYSDDELTSLGRQQVGVGNALGQDLLRRVGRSQERLRRIFEGTLATGPVRLGRRTSDGSSISQSDVGR